MASTPRAEPALSALFSPRGVVLVWLPLIAVALLHYLTPPDPHWVHDVARRLYYVPILMAGTLGGLRGGLLTAVAVEVAYVPHAFLVHAFHDPGTPSEKLLEMVFYVVLGVAVGAISDRAAREQRHLVALSADLQETLEQVQAKEAELERAARLEALGQLTAGLAHEIRNPLHAMRGAAEILLDAVPPDAPEREIGVRQIGEIDRLSEVLTRFLRFAKGQEPQMLPLDLSQVAVHVQSLIEAQAQRQGVEVEVAIGPEESATVLADRGQLVQVILGICINAMQAMQSGGVVRMTAVQGDQGEVGLRIQNSGAQIPEEILQTMFDPFVSTRTEGTGLGLSTAWRIIDEHGGRIEAANLDTGVAFVVWLPSPG